MTPIKKGTASRLGLRMPTEVESEPLGPWRAVFLQWGSEKTEEFDYRLHAVAHLHYGADRGTLAPVALVGPGGVRVTGEELHQELDWYERYTWS